MRPDLFVASFLALMIVVVTASGPARAGDVTSLDEAIAEAYVNNRSLDAERAAARAVDEKLPQAKAGWRPTVSIAATQGIQHCQGTQNQGEAASSTGVCGVNNGTNGGSTNLSPETYGLTIVQPVYKGGLQAEASQARDLIASERAKLTSTEQNVFLSTVTSFMDTVLAQAELKLDRDAVDVVRHQWDVTRAQARVGEVTDTDVKQAEAALADALAQREMASGKVKESAAALAHDIGMPVGTLRDPAGLPLLPPDRDAAISLAARENPDVVTAKFAEMGTEEDIKQIRGELLPTVSLNASIERTKEVGRAGLQEDTGLVFAQLSVPLYEGGSVYSRSREAQQTAAQQKSLVDDARLTAMQTAAENWDKLTAASATITALKTEISADAAALDGVQHEQRVGARTVQDVLIAEQTLLTAQTSLAQARHDALIAAYTVRAAVGQLTASSLNSPVEIYDPEIHLNSVRGKWAGFGADDGAPPRLLKTSPLRPLRGVVAPDVLEAPPRSESAFFGASGSDAAPAAVQVHAAVVQPAAIRPASGAVDFDHSSDPLPAASKWMDSTTE